MGAQAGHERVRLFKPIAEVAETAWFQADAGGNKGAVLVEALLKGPKVSFLSAGRQTGWEAGYYLDVSNLGASDTQLAAP